MKKEIKRAVKRVKVAYGLEETLPQTDISEPISPETIRHQRFTNRVMNYVDGAVGAVYLGSACYGFYHAIHGPEIISQAGQFCQDVLQYVPFMNS